MWLDKWSLSFLPGNSALTEKSPQCRCFHSDEGTWEGEAWHAAPLLRREVQKSPQCQCFHSDEDTWEGELEGEAINEGTWRVGMYIPKEVIKVQKVSPLQHAWPSPFLFHLVGFLP